MCKRVFTCIEEEYEERACEQPNDSETAHDEVDYMGPLVTLEVGTEGTVFVADEHRHVHYEERHDQDSSLQEQ